MTAQVVSQVLYAVGSLCFLVATLITLAGMIK